MGKLWDDYIQTKEKEEPKEQSFLIGDPISWADIKNEDNQKQWLWENYIAKGNVTLLSALWKAGKSTLLRCLFLAMSEEAEFAGQPTHKCKVLVLSEEDKGEWSDKREELEDEQIKNVFVWARPLRMKPNLKQWTELCEKISQVCITEGYEMVVIDTLTTFWPIDNENDSAQVIKALVPLYNFTENNIGVLLVHHFRKGGGDQAQASRGSGALPGFVDNIIEFTRNDNGFSTQRVLKTYGRFDSVVPTVVIDLLGDGTYKTLGDPSEVSKSFRLAKLLEIFKDLKNTESLTVKEIYSIWSKTSSSITLRTIQRFVKEMTTKNILIVVKEESVVSKKVPYYALNNGFQGNLGDNDNGITPPSIPVVSSSSVAILSSSPQKQARDDDTTGASVIREWKEPDPRW